MISNWRFDTLGQPLAEPVEANGALHLRSSAGKVETGLLPISTHNTPPLDSAI
jgi:hypothetical protein